jgi:hypothetical protein
VLAAVNERKQAYGALMSKWNAFKTQELAAVNTQLKAAGLSLIEIKE